MPAPALLRGLPVSSSGSRTAVGDSVGSKTQLHSLFAAAAVALTLLFAGSLLARFPVATLGAIVVYAALRLIDVAEFRRLFGFQRAEFAIAVVAAVGVIAVGALYGVLFAVSLSIIELIRRVARPHDGILGYVPGVAGMHDIDDYPDAKLVPGLLVYRYDAPLFFVNADDFKRRALAALDDASTPVEWFLLNAEANVGIDITAIDALDDLHRELEQRGIVFAMARVKQDLFVQLDRAGFIERVDRDRIFATLPTAVQEFAKWYEARHGQPPPGLTIPDRPHRPRRNVGRSRRAAGVLKRGVRLGLALAPYVEARARFWPSVAYLRAHRAGAGAISAICGVFPRPAGWLGRDFGYVRRICAPDRSYGAGGRGCHLATQQTANSVCCVTE